MFTFSPLADNKILMSIISFKRVTKSSWQKPVLPIATLTTILLLAGCQQPSDSAQKVEDSQSSEQTSVDESKVATQSDSTAALIEQNQPLYVAQMQGLQRRLQAEYESLQVADISDNNSLNDNATNAESIVQDSNDMSDVDDTDTETDTAKTEINTSTEVGERDLEVLKRISLEPREPKIITEAQMIERYQQAIQALYQPVTVMLSAQEVDTLINIATLLPQLFEDTEIAERLSIKSPALARLIVQYQVWQQIEAQQGRDMQKMKLTQQQEFEGLMTKFNDTIKDYDEQIAKYEQTLEGFQ